MLIIGCDFHTRYSADCHDGYPHRRAARRTRFTATCKTRRAWALKRPGRFIGSSVCSLKRNGYLLGS
jgi:hypothetical protein